MSRHTDAMRPVHPGEVLREDYLLPLRMSARALASATGIAEEHIRALLREEGHLDAATARRLTRFFGGDAQSWVNLQADYDNRAARAPDDLRRERDAERLGVPVEELREVEEAIAEYRSDPSAVIPLEELMEEIDGEVTVADLDEEERVRRAAIEFDMPEEHIRALDEGLEDLRRNPLAGRPWEEVMSELLTRSHRENREDGASQPATADIDSAASRPTAPETDMRRNCHADADEWDLNAEQARALDEAMEDYRRNPRTGESWAEVVAWIKGSR